MREFNIVCDSQRCKVTLLQQMGGHTLPTDAVRNGLLFASGHGIRIVGSGEYNVASVRSSSSLDWVVPRRLFD